MTAPFNEAAASPLDTSSELAPDVLRLEFSRNLGHISRQSAVFFIGTIFTMAAGYLVKIYVARVLGAELLGVLCTGHDLGEPDANRGHAGPAGNRRAVRGRL